MPSAFANLQKLSNEGQSVRVQLDLQKLAKPGSDAAEVCLDRQLPAQTSAIIYGQVGGAMHRR